MKVGDVVRKINVLKPLVGVVLEVKTTHSVTIGQVTFNKKRTEIRFWCPERPRMAGYFSDVQDFEVINEAK